MSFFGGRRSKKSAPPPDTPIAKPPTVIKRNAAGFETVIGSKATILGELRTQSDVRIDGTFEGTLEIEGNVLVGETGKIVADIHARNVSVAGAVRGDISGKKVQLLRTARVWGNISASAITTEEGAFIDGKLTMVQHQASQNSMQIPKLPDPAQATDDAEEELELVEGETVEPPVKEAEKS